MSTSEERPKIVYIEWLRALAAFAVVGIHITMTEPNNCSVAQIGKSNYMALTSVYALVQWAVPVFLMISGGLLLRAKSISMAKVKKYIARMFFVLLMFGTVYAILELVFSERRLSLPMLYKGIIMTFEGKSWSHLWYLYVLIGIYIILIPLKVYVDHIELREVASFIAVLIVGNFLIPTLNILLGVEIKNLMVLTQYVTYFLIGYVLAGISNTKWGGVIWISVYLGTSILKIVIQCATVIRTGEGSELFLNDRILTLFQAIAVYMYIMNVAKSRKLNKIIKSIGDCSFGIYLIHPFFINFLYKVLLITPTGFMAIYISIPLLWIIVFCVSWIGTLAMKKIPVFNRIL